MDTDTPDHQSRGFLGSSATASRQRPKQTGTENRYEPGPIMRAGKCGVCGGTMMMAIRPRERNGWRHVGGGSGGV